MQTIIKVDRGQLQQSYPVARRLSMSSIQQHADFGRWSTRLCVAAGLLARLLLWLTGSSPLLSARVELVSATCSGSRLHEAVRLLELGRSPYAGHIYHDAPLWPFLLLHSGLPLLPLTLLSQLVVSYSLFLFSPYASALYWLNPLVISSWAAGSTTSLTIHAPFLLSLFTASWSPFLSSALLALPIYSDLYPVLLLPGWVLLVPKNRRIFSVLTCLSTLSALLFISLLTCSSSFTSLLHPYLFRLTVPDLTPNLGVFWYLCTEIFDRFRVFFLLVFHAPLLFYLPPLLLRFHSEPMFLCYVLFSLVALFKSYPAASDHALAWSLLLVVAPRFRSQLVRLHLHVLLMLFAVCCGLVMWHLWIYPGSGNANFFYNQTLIFALSHCLILAEACTAMRKTLLQQNKGNISSS